jgi:hypothetical protein
MVMELLRGKRGIHSSLIRYQTRRVVGTVERGSSTDSRTLLTLLESIGALYRMIMCSPLRSRVQTTAHVHYARSVMSAFFF